MPNAADVPHEALRRILAVAQPERVVLFGSWARGEVGPDSDMDLLVVLPYGGERHRIAIALLVALADLPVPKDVIVLTPQEWAIKQELPGSLAYNAAREGIVLYAA